MRAALYLRLSRDTETSTSIERQRESCRAYATARGWQVVAEAEDVDVSGSKVAPAARPGFASLLDRHDVDVIVAYRIDRVARSVSDFSHLLRHLDERGIALVSSTEPFDLTEPLGKALLYLVAIFAEMEADAISARTASSIRKLRGTTRWSHGGAPYGYRIVPVVDGPGKTLQVDEEQAEVVREATARVLAGEAVFAIAADLAERGIPAPRGGRWAATSLRRMLQSDSLLGRVRHRGQLVRGDDGAPLEPFDPILDVDTLERLRAVLQPRRSVDARRRHLLSGLCVCASCGTKLSVGQAGSGHGGMSYRCGGRANGCTAPASVKAEWLEPLVEEWLLEHYGDRPIMRRSRPRAAAGLADLEAQIREVAGQLASAQPGDEDELLDLLRTLKARRVELSREVAQPGLEPLGITLADVWRDQPATARRATMLDMQLEVRVSPGRRGARQLDPARVEVTAAP